MIKEFNDKKMKPSKNSSSDNNVSLPNIKRVIGNSNFGIMSGTSNLKTTQVSRVDLMSNSVNEGYSQNDYSNAYEGESVLATSGIQHIDISSS